MKKNNQLMSELYDSSVMCKILVLSDEKRNIAFIQFREGTDVRAYLTSTSAMKDITAVSVLRFPYDDKGELETGKLEKSAEEIVSLCEKADESIGRNNYYVYYDTSVPDGKVYHISEFLGGVSADTGETHDKNNAHDNIDFGSRPDAIVYGGDTDVSALPGMRVADILLRASHEHSDDGVYFYEDSDNPEFISYSNIEKMARRLVTGLAEHGIKNRSRLIFQFSSSKDYVTMFWASMLSGIIPAMYDIPASYNTSSAQADTLLNIWKQLDEPKICVSSSMYDDYIAYAEKLGISSEKIISIDEISESDIWDGEPEMSPDDEAVMFFTSGSTGMPKGVVQTYRAIAVQQIGMNKLLNFKKDIGLNWMPLEHPGGVIMAHLRSVFMGSTQVQVDKNYILAEPLRWIELINKHRVGFSWAPHFAFSMLADLAEETKETGWDLSCVTCLLDGGEMVNAVSGRKFLEAFSRYGLKDNVLVPAWGMCETCSGTLYSTEFSTGEHSGTHHYIADENGVVSFFDKKNEKTTTVTEIGVPVPGVSVRITDSRNNVVPEDVIGRFQIKGHPVTKGYYKNPEVNKASYSDDGWFITGDLGFIHNGKMSLTGREKDIIIINGLNYNNVEIESLIEELHEVKKSFTAITSYYDEKSGRDKTIVFYVKANEEDDSSYITRKIISHVQKNLKIRPDYVLAVSEDDIPKTNLGKIQRAKMAKQFLEGKYDKLVKDTDILLKNENTIGEWFYTRKWNEEKLLSDKLPSSEDKVLYIRGNEEDFFVSQLEKHCNELKIAGIDEIQKAFDDNRKYNLIIFGASLCSPENTGELIDGLINGIAELSRAIENSGNKSARLAVITSDVFNTGKNDGANYYCGALSGFCKCINAEFTEMAVSFIDTDKESAEKAAIEVLSGCFDDEVVYRNSNRYVMSLEKCNMSKIAEKESYPSGLYTVTGGLGGVGAVVCRYLLSHNDTYLLVTGRSGLDSADKADIFHGLENSAPGRVLYAACDVADEAGMIKAIENAEKQFGCNLRRIYHCAVDYGFKDYWNNVNRYSICNMNMEDYKIILEAKTEGAIALRNIIRVKKDAGLRYFSSTNAFLGSISFSAYAAANSFMEQLAEHEYLCGGLDIKAVSFSSWKELGMSKTIRLSRAGELRGSLGVSPNQGIVCLESADKVDAGLVYTGLDAGGTYVGRYASRFEDNILKPHVFVMKDSEKSDSEFPEGTEIITADKLYDADGVFSPVFSEVPVKTDVADEDELKLRRIWADVLGDSDINDDSDFFECGGQSLSVTKLCIAVKKEFGTEISVKSVFIDSSFSGILNSIRNAKA